MSIKFEEKIATLFFEEGGGGGSGGCGVGWRDGGSPLLPGSLSAVKPNISE